jgi:hypothetical protein
MFNYLNNDIISKSQLHEKISKNTLSEDIFAKTVTYSGIQHNFHFDIPEIINYEKSLQDRTNDIKKFTNLAISNPNNLSHNDRVRELYTKTEFYGSEYENYILSELSTNNDLLKDLGL